MSEQKDRARARRAEVAARALGVEASVAIDAAGTENDRTVTTPRRGPAGSVTKAAALARRVGAAILAGSTALSATLTLTDLAQSTSFTGGATGGVPGGGPSAPVAPLVTFSPPSPTQGAAVTVTLLSAGATSYTFNMPGVTLSGSGATRTFTAGAAGAYGWTATASNAGGTSPTQFGSLTVASVPSTAMAPTLTTINPATEWAPISQGVRLPAGNNAAASEPAAYFTQANANPGIWTTGGGFFLWAGRLPLDTLRGNRSADLFLGSSPTGNRLKVNGTGTASNPSTIIFGWSRSGLVPSTGNIQVPLPSESDVLIAVVRDPSIVIGTGVSLRMVVLSLRTGAVLQSATYDAAGNGFGGSSAAAAFGGGWGKGDATVANSTASLQGSLLFSISGRGAAPTDAQLQQIALGGAPEAVLSGVTWDFYRDLKGFNFASPPAGVAAPAGITETMTTASVPVGTGFFAANTARRQSLTKYLRPTMTWRRGEIFGIKPGASTRTITVTAEASAGVAPEFRIVLWDGRVVCDWTAMASAGGGNWTGSAALGWFADWAVVEYRDALAPTDPLTRALWTDYFAIGPIFAFYGQSELANNWNNNVGAGLALDTAARGRVTWANANTALGYTEYVVLTPTTRSAADGVYSTVNQWIAMGGGPCVIAMDAVGATPNAESLGGTWGTRPYQNYLNTVALIGNQHVTILYSWGVHDAGNQQTWGTSFWDAVFYGTGPAVGASGSMPAGLATKNFSTLFASPSFIFSPLGRKRSGNAAPLTTPQFVQYAQNRRSGATWAAANGFVVGPYAGDTKLADQFHQLDGSPNGDRLYGARLAQACGRAFNLWPAADPTVASVTLTAANVYTVTFNRPSGGALYSPAPTALTGWMVNGSIAGFTAALVGNAVTLTKSSGNWTGAETVTYEGDAPRDTGYVNRGVNAAADDALQDPQIAGVLYETYAGDILGLGKPVVPYW